MTYEPESKKAGYPDSISLECTDIIIKQMRSKVCKIFSNSCNGTGFFCKIKFPNNKLVPVLITNNHVIGESILNDENQKISYSIYKKEMKYIKLNNRMKYTSPQDKFDVTIIEIKESDKINDEMFFDLELNENNSDFYKKTIYTLHYPGEKGISVSYGILDEIFLDKKYEFQHFCTTDRGSSGSPILDIQENKIIGVHKAAKGNAYNLGTFINYPVKEFIEEN